ncbi:cysteine proteinase inhibitor 6-like [Zingiber officinale]|uniref:cysteine proteinase inhibitor 6-like n=1 Tax=Zingiber officinale TaxID=94328 RepID=UPI001C4B5C12|nr:cysteine proteinase inhibitor 6-like [Zingiber officinale]
MSIVILYDADFDIYFDVHNALLKFTQLLKAKEQVVAGKMYYLTLEDNDCGSKKQYEAKVWVKPWMNFMELEDFKPLTDSPSTSSQDKKQLEQSSEGEKKESVGAPSENRILKQKKSKKEKSSKEQEEHDQNQEKGDIEAEVVDASAVDVKERIKKVASMR